MTGGVRGMQTRHGTRERNRYPAQEKEEGDEMNFKLKIIPPTATAQEHKIAIVKGKPVFYDSAKLKETRKLFEILLKKRTPTKPLKRSDKFSVEWRFFTKTYMEGSMERVRIPITLKSCRRTA